MHSKSAVVKGHSYLSTSFFFFFLAFLLFLQLGTSQISAPPATERVQEEVHGGAKKEHRATSGFRRVAAHEVFFFLCTKSWRIKKDALKTPKMYFFLNV